MPMGLWKSKFGPSPPEITGEARMILRRVGLALIVFGLLDIGVMVYCIANGVNYSSSFNVFAVLAGTYVRRGHPWWVKWTTRAPSRRIPSIVSGRRHSCFSAQTRSGRNACAVSRTSRFTSPTIGPR